MQGQTHKKFRFLRFTLSLGLILGAVLIYLNHQLIIDNYSVWRYQPTKEIAQIVDRSDMSEVGRLYFYASHPELSNRETFNKICALHGDHTVVLGCYTARRIYIFDIQDSRLDGIREVTAVHEMLHAAYDRLGKSEKARVDYLLERQLSINSDQRVTDLVDIYDRVEPGERNNELHSIYGSEVGDLDSELESYYSQYFEDRQKTVALFASYQQVFESISAQQEQIVTELNNLAQKINSSTDEYNVGVDRLNRDVAEFNQRAASGGYSTQAAFDEDRAELIARQQILASLRGQIDVDIAAYNSKRELLIAINGEVQELNESINSNALEPQPAI